MAVPITVTVNSQTHSGEVEPRTPLVSYLREVLSLTGTHVGCDTSNCGAEITTIEGLAPEGGLHPLQEAFRETHGLQCGFCTPGMILAAWQLLERNENPSDAEIRHSLEGNFCRCTGYDNIVKAVQHAAQNA